MSPEVRRLMNQCNKQLDSIENTISHHIDLSNNNTKDEIIARQSAIIENLTNQLKDIRNNL